MKFNRPAKARPFALSTIMKDPGKNTQAITDAISQED